MDLVGAGPNDVTPELDKSQESVASPSCQYSPSGVLLTQQLSQVDREWHKRHSDVKSLFSVSTSFVMMLLNNF